MRILVAGRPCVATIVDAPATGKGHDRWSAMDQLIAVADGATPLEADDGDPGGLAAHVLASLARSGAGPARQRLRAAIEDAAARPSVGRASTAVAAVVDSPAGLRAIVLGDCEVNVVAGGAVTRVTDRRLGRLDARVLRVLRQRLDSGEPPRAARQAIEALLRANRAKLNSDRGYWVAAPGAEDVARHAILRVVPADFEAIVIATDGFARIWSLFDLADPAAVAQMRPRDVTRLVRTLRLVEHEHADDPASAQFSASDDATAVIVLPEHAG